MVGRIPGGADPRFETHGIPLGRHAAVVGALVCAGFLAACGPGGGQAAPGEDEPPELIVLVFDRSASLRDYQLELAEDLVNERLTHLDHGDRIAAIEVLQRSLAEPPKRWTQAVPEPEYPDIKVSSDSVNLTRFIRDAQDYLRFFSDTADRGGIMGTDLLSTMHDVEAEVRAYPDFRATMYVFSDMLQSTGSIEMEGGRRMPPAGWIQEARDDGRLPDLSGLCVAVVGARTDTQLGQRVKAFWKSYFEATGAEFRSANYMLRPVRLPTHPCAGTS